MGYFSNILFSVLGLDVIAMHAGFVKKPRTTFPIAVGISAVIILLSLVGSALGLCIIMSPENITILNGLMDALNVFFTVNGHTHSYIIIGVCIIIGGLGIAASWMISLARGLHVSLCMIKAPKWLLILNKNQVPSRVILMQAVAYTLLLIPFLLSDNINKSYWLLSALTAQFALVYYIILFCAAMILIKRTQKGLRFWQAFLCMCGCCLCLTGIVAGFISPSL
jgi:amino acid transporter